MKGKLKMAKPKLGSGKRFSSGVAKIEREGLSKKSAGAIMAKAGAKKYGQKKMSQLASRGRKRG